MVADVDGMTSVGSTGGFVSMEGDDKAVTVRISEVPQGTRLEPVERSRILLHIPAGNEPLRLSVRLWAGSKKEQPAAFAALGVNLVARDLTPLTKGGKARFNQTVATKGVRGEDKNAYTVDKINVPFNNPYKSWMRFGALDFLADGRAVITTWSGD